MKLHSSLKIVFAFALFSTSPAYAINIVQNGSFEQVTGVPGPGQLAPAFNESAPNADIGRILTGWTKQCIADCTGGNVGGGSQGFAFILDGNADSTGFQSIFSDGFTPSKNIKIWGPGSGSVNGFGLSPDGGLFVGIDGGYGRSSLSQTVSGLVVGQSYDLKFYYAGAQFTDIPILSPNNDTEQSWEVEFGSQTQRTPTRIVPSGGFAGWLQATMNFVASAPQQQLKFTALGGNVGGNFAPSGLPPFLLLDGVQLSTPNQPPEPVPGPLPILGGTAALAWSRKLRQRLGRGKKS